jgi:hypothetical protein
MMLLMVMVKLISSKYHKRYKRDTERLSDYDSGIETDHELSVSQTWRSDQPIHGGDHQTFEMKKTVIRPFVSHLLDPSNSLTPKIDYSTCFLSSYK